MTLGTEITVIRVGWFAFEGFGRPFEGWRERRCIGRAFTRRGARRKAARA